MKTGAIAITGSGAICSIGNTADAIGRSLANGVSGIGHLRHLDLPFPELYFGEVALTNAQLRETSALTGDQPRSRTALLAIHAALEAIGGGRAERDTVVISASTVGGMDLSERHFAQWRHGEMGSVEDAREHPVGSHTDHVAHAIGSTAFRTTISTACSSSTNAIAIGAQMLQQGRARRVLAGGADALCRFTVEGFRSLSAMDDKPCRPFSADRRGMNLGEGAAYLVLERLGDVQRDGREPLAILAGWANRNDAYHQTATSPDGHGPYITMRAALECAGLKPEEIDHINAHGTGTENNDETELAAMERLFENVPAFCSTKSLTGHTLAAAGALEAVIAIHCVRNGLVPAGAASILPMPGHRSAPMERSAQRPVRNVLSNSFGFGGNCAALVITHAP